MEAGTGALPLLHGHIDPAPALLAPAHIQGCCKVGSRRQAELSQCQWDFQHLQRSLLGAWRPRLSTQLDTSSFLGA